VSEQRRDSEWSVTAAIESISRGGMAIVVDDQDRENEGDLVMAAERATPEAINFMAKHGRGLICAPMMRSRLEELRIPPMVEDNADPRQTAFHVGVDLRDATTTGISAADRAATIRALADPAARADHFTRPGHVFPLAYANGGRAAPRRPYRGVDRSDGGRRAGPGRRDL
jgi:3,4-dihydroxy 2-butanone 4-phosphate synthase / GTP cyclohydrolase II